LKLAESPPAPSTVTGPLYVPGCSLIPRLGRIWKSTVPPAAIPLPTAVLFWIEKPVGSLIVSGPVSVVPVFVIVIVRHSNSPKPVSALGKVSVPV